MAMNKREREELEKAKREVRLREMLTLLPLIPPDVPAPNDGETVGWLCGFYSHRISVARVKSTVSSHYTLDSMGRYIGSGSQGSRALYSTRALAYEAAKRKAVWDMAEELLTKVEQHERGF